MLSTTKNRRGTMSVAKNFINIERFESGRLNKGETTRTA